ncbi:uncharacterized protein B0I36DRAFT_88507 [Microdochium trichocladiopsis]|uniref:Uncharacterized protein n=1 Tax=Microdochium trichocladiopsis TaxID=1682393 RepID=A0A9P8YDW2_9PEZI|nr:uncharacterized protein B0I36DRAFT_88507 [Microdochium trichocladiopsis]KAH7035127.1 hypothetical protein B0I36DRAFT_88507 [Microdochium trichocladiopsis]
MLQTPATDPRSPEHDTERWIPPATVCKLASSSPTVPPPRQSASLGRIVRSSEPPTRMRRTHLEGTELANNLSVVVWGSTSPRGHNHNQQGRVAYILIVRLIREPARSQFRTNRI